ncbi:putative lysine-specific demethylase JMJD5 [Cyphellophora attinorum]|uniref:Putative lysine-specific demethylase JMJD5 n=1 Tax=Cyphellophora attinorum TaxID=1664694 RepID=A0A0N1H2C0_9EURO|nr:putative lysine-specific demethylase JMJD5 [Phialophora attinorum]KPI38764.1 putative lysine-specific demethylase JMJD5 [Phialophora attinorum]
MPWLGRLTRPLSSTSTTRVPGYVCPNSAVRWITSISRVPSLPSWDVELFREKAFEPALPHTLARCAAADLPATSLWFTHDSHPFNGVESLSSVPVTFELNLDFWKQYENEVVPLELRRTDEEPRFERKMLPLKVLLDHDSSVASESSSTSMTKRSVYLAQCSLSSLPAALRDALPLPPLLRAGKGDIYDSSLWMGRPPTFTPMHRDPNPNMFVQLAGQKVIRLLPPNVGQLVFRLVQQAAHSDSNSRFRGNEMMVGKESKVIESGIWGSENEREVPPVVEDITAVVQRYGQEATLSTGEGLFIPKGWWHSVRGVGKGINASVNWWHR